MIRTTMRNRILDEVRDLLDQDFTKIDIRVSNLGYIITPTKITDIVKKQSDSNKEKIKQDNI